jgi:lysozyme family protein
VVFDCAVNSGPGRAAKFLQETIGVTADGDIGPKTLKALEAHFLSEVVSVYQDKRLRFMKSLPTWSTFGKGWERRVIEVAKVGELMLDINSA